MTRSAIATTRKKPPTAAERLATLDPDLARLFDEVEATLNQEWDLALNENPAPPILDEEEKLAFAVGELMLATEPLLDIADGLRTARDEAYVTLGRVEQEIAKRYVEALRVTQPAALPPPGLLSSDDSNPTVQLGGGNGGDGDPGWEGGDPDHLGWDNGEDTEDFRNLRATPDPEPTETGPDGLPIGTPPWDDPEGASTAHTVETVTVERPRASSGRGPRWWARIVTVSAAVSTVGFGLWMAGLHLLGGGS